MSHAPTRFRLDSTRAARAALAATVVVLPLLAACTPASATWEQPTPEAWAELRRELSSERASNRVTPWTANVSATLNEPRSGRVLDARGALAVSPGRALRMILVAGAGATVLDTWVTPDAWRVEVPPASLVQRGRSEEPPELPIGFLRSWFFRPLGGTLFAAGVDRGRSRWLLRDADAVVDLSVGTCDRGKHLRMTRRARARTERLDVCERAGLRPSAGDRVRYIDDENGLSVALAIESVADEPPPAAAFDDPDDGGTR
jgi:hypothetical protein